MEIILYNILNMIFDEFKLHGIELNEHQVREFEYFLDLFVEFNEHTNLSAIREPADIVSKHFIDSVMLSKFVELKGRLLDIGTGGGFPAIPLKILRRDLTTVMMDSIGKKTKACEYFIDKLHLSKSTTINARAEDPVAMRKFANHFDVVASRATAYLPVILEWSVPYLKHNGVIYLYKTPSTEEYEDGQKVLNRLKLVQGETFGYELAGQTRQILTYSKK